MMCSDPQNFSRGPKLENHFFQSWISAKRFERFLIFFKNQKRTIFYPNLPPDTFGYWKKSYTMTTGTEKQTKNVHLRFLIFETSSHTFFNDRKSIFQNVKMCELLKKSEISQNVLQKSMTEKNDFRILGRVKSFVGSSPSFSTPNFLSGTPEKCFNFMIPLDHNCIFLIIRKTLKSIYDQK